MKKERSAGAVVVYNLTTPRYLLLHYASGHWDFPKGHVEHGETNEATALREIKEETGLTPNLIKGFNEKINYFFKQDNTLISKDVIFFLAEANNKTVTVSHEHTGYVWLSYEEALERITFKNSKTILQKAHNFLLKKKKA